jgi:hypothetical protein
MQLGMRCAALLAASLALAIAASSPAMAQKITIPGKRSGGAPPLVYEPPALTYEKPRTAYEPPVVRQPITRDDCPSARGTRRCVTDAPKFSSGR